MAPISQIVCESYREREERERKKQKLAQELRQCIRLQEQWRAIQRLIEAEEDRLIEECRAQQRRLSQMQQDERHRKAEQLAAIRQRLQRTLEMEEVSIDKESFYRTASQVFFFLSL